MKTEERLKISYESQKKIFEESKASKIKNLEAQKQQIQSKISKLNETLDRLCVEQKKISEKSFRSFQDFLKTAQDQANSTNNSSN